MKKPTQTTTKTQLLSEVQRLSRKVAKLEVQRHRGGFIHISWSAIGRTLLALLCWGAVALHTWLLVALGRALEFWDYLYWENIFWLMIYPGFFEGAFILGAGLVTGWCIANSWKWLKHNVAIPLLIGVGVGITVATLFCCYIIAGGAPSAIAVGIGAVLGGFVTAMVCGSILSGAD